MRSTANVALLLRSVGALRDQNLIKLGYRRITSLKAGQDTIYTSDQKDVVIDKLNSIRTNSKIRTILGSKLCLNIETHLQKKGNFTKLEELLQVQSIGPKTIRTVCDKLLGLNSSSAHELLHKPLLRRARGSVNPAYPPIPPHVCAVTKVLLTIVVDVGSISWALVDSKMKNLLHWKTVEIDETCSTLKDLIIVASRVEKLIPISDLYIIESPTVGSVHNRSGHQLKSQLTTALATAIHNNRENQSELKLVFVKRSLVERHFDASVGSESVSLQPFLSDVINQKTPVNRSNLFVSQDNVAYLKTLAPIQREQLCRATLLAISVIDVVLAWKDLPSST